MKDMCYIHGYEPIPPTYYCICGECGHCFVTEQELIVKNYGQGGGLKAGKDIHICPECTHDF